MPARGIAQITIHMHTEVQLSFGVHAMHLYGNLQLQKQAILLYYMHLTNAGMQPKLLQKTQADQLSNDIDYKTAIQSN